MLPEPQLDLKKQQTNNETRLGQDILPDPSVLVTLSDRLAGPIYNKAFESLHSCLDPRKINIVVLYFCLIYAQENGREGLIL